MPWRERCCLRAVSDIPAHNSSSSPHALQSLFGVIIRKMWYFWPCFHWQPLQGVCPAFDLCMLATLLQYEMSYCPTDEIHPGSSVMSLNLKGGENRDARVEGSNPTAVVGAKPSCTNGCDVALGDACTRWLISTLLLTGRLCPCLSLPQVQKWSRLSVRGSRWEVRMERRFCSLQTKRRSASAPRNFVSQVWAIVLFQSSPQKTFNIRYLKLLPHWYAAHIHWYRQVETISLSDAGLKWNLHPHPEIWHAEWLK